VPVLTGLGPKSGTWRPHFSAGFVNLLSHKKCARVPEMGPEFGTGFGTGFGTAKLDKLEKSEMFSDHCAPPPSG